MPRLAVTAAAVATVALGCGSSPPPPPVLSNTSAAPLEPEATGPASGATDGALWTCQIGDYDPQPCKLGRDGDRWTLRKLLGSQRFRGAVTFAPDGSITFDGSYFCPWGECDQPMQTTFQRTDDGGYATGFDNDTIRLEWNPDNARAYGGAGYGALTGDETGD